jgi:O-acetyl-ADP-ribose deacetylase (regulator of RNase III)
MIEHNGSVFDAFFSTEFPDSNIIVHGCNAKGVMGSGVAKVVKDIFPKAYYDYIKEHEEVGLKLGKVIFSNVGPGQMIANAITQQSCGKKPIQYVDYDAVRTCFNTIRDLVDFTAENSGIQMTVHYPMIGAGLGGGDWKIISAIIDEELDGLNHHLWKI